MAETRRSTRVLVVEDEDNIAIALDYLMTREGYDLRPRRQRRPAP